MMQSLTLDQMRAFLSKSISSINANKLNGMLAEVAFRDYISELGFSHRVSPGGWIARSEARGGSPFGERTVALFPETIQADHDYAPTRPDPVPDRGLHTVCATFHQLGISSYFCSATVPSPADPFGVKWRAMQLGIPTQEPYRPLASAFGGYTPRTRRYQFLRHRTDVSAIPPASVQQEFSKESLRVAVSDDFMAEIADIDGLIWGNRHTYPVEIKEKTLARDKSVGEYFGLDIGPFVKLAFYAAKKGNLHSLFVVRQIDDTTSRQLVQWWHVRFDVLAQFASWNFVGGGKSMGGGMSATVRIPLSAFKPLDRAAFEAL